MPTHHKVVAAGCLISARSMEVVVLAIKGPVVRVSATGTVTGGCGNGAYRLRQTTSSST